MNNPTLFERYRCIIPNWDAFHAALKRPLPTCIWANPLKITPEKLETLLAKQGIELEPLTWRTGAYRLLNTERPGSRMPYLAGLYHIQEEVSLLPVHLLDLKPGQRVLDTCAAPGNKTAQIATELKNTGTVIANDRNFRRMRPLGRTMDRLGIINTSLITADAANLSRHLGTFDRILVDAPCSCEGTSRKNTTPHQATKADFNQLVPVQRSILKRAVELCRPGGRIVYSTCTYAPEENEAIVDSILKEFGPALDLLPAQITGFPAQPGLIQWQGQSFDPRQSKCLRVYPHDHDTGGFFVAVLQRLQ